MNPIEMADQAERELNRYRWIEAMVEYLRKVGSLEQAVMQSENKLKELRSEIDAHDATLKDKEAALAKETMDAKARIAAAEIVAAEIQQAADARADAALSDARTRADELQQKRRVQMDGELAKHQVQLNEIDAAVKAGKAEITAMQQKQGKLTEELAALEQKLKAAKEAARKVLA